MGNRVHVVKKQREYGSKEAFNHQYEQFKTLLRNLTCDVYEEDEGSRNFEMSCVDYERAMKILSRIKDALDKDENTDLNKIDLSDCIPVYDIEVPDWCRFDISRYDFNDVKDTLKKFPEYSIEEILKIMQDFFDERDKNSDWIQFSSF